METYQNMVEDILEKDSKESRFIQACDFISRFARRLVGKAAGLDDGQITELRRLEQGVAAVFQNHWHYARRKSSRMYGKASTTGNPKQAPAFMKFPPRPARRTGGVRIVCGTGGQYPRMD